MNMAERKFTAKSIQPESRCLITAMLHKNSSFISTSVLQTAAITTYSEPSVVLTLTLVFCTVQNIWILHKPQLLTAQWFLRFLGLRVQIIQCISFCDTQVQYIIQWFFWIPAVGVHETK
jgi:hypothetical protein